MQFDEIISIIQKSKQSDWVYNDFNITYVYKPNVSIRIVKISQKHGHLEDFHEEWAENHPSASIPSRVYFHIYYNSTCIKELVFVSIDGNRAVLPMPDAESRKTISRENYQYAKIVDDMGNLDDYIKRSGLNIES